MGRDYPGIGGIAWDFQGVDLHRRAHFEAWAATRKVVPDGLHRTRTRFWREFGPLRPNPLRTRVFHRLKACLEALLVAS